MFKQLFDTSSNEDFLPTFLNKIFNYGYKAYKAYKAGGNWKEVGWAVASNYVKPLKIAKKALGVMTQRQAFRTAKRAAGIPTSAQFKNHKFVYDGKTEHRTVYSFGAVGRGGHNKFVVQHKHDKSGRGPHYHAVGDKTKGRSNNPLSTKGKYNQLDGHYPENKKGYKKKKKKVIKLNERLERIKILREKVEEKATRQKFLMLCPSIKNFEVVSGDKISSVVEFLIHETPTPVKVTSKSDTEQVIDEIKGFERELTSLLSKKIIVWYAHEN
ncbi:hypothetical protein PDN41_07290 [Bacillus cereus]|nr:hypothetical protein [Bacillus cereus]